MIIRLMLPLWRGVLLGLLSASAWAGDASDWLARLGDAYRTVNFSGTFVYSYADGVETLSVVHSSSNGHVQERMQSLNGVPREILRDGDSVACILPDSNKVVVGDGANKFNVAGRYQNLDIDKLADLYTVSMGNRLRIANRNCRLLTIEPRDLLRYGYRLCLDEQHGVLLRSQVTDEIGKVVEDMVFTDIRFPSHIEGSELAASVRLDHFDVVQQSSADLKNPASRSEHWMIGNVPAGFTARGVLWGNGVEHRVLSDGLATISVFIEALPKAESPQLGAAQVGAVKTYSTRVGDYLATVVGEVPAATVRQVASSIRRIGP